MIADCHTHVSCPVAETDIAALADACKGVAAAIVLPFGVDSSLNINTQIAGAIKENSKMAGFAVINPTTDKLTSRNIKSLTVDLGLKGVVLYCSEAGFHPAHSRAMRFYEIAQDLSLPIFFHNCGSLSANAVLDYAQPYLLDEIARTFSGLKIIVGSMGVPFVRQTLAMVAKHENVFADLTISPSKVWEVYNIVLAAHEASVMDKLIFGSGYPYASPQDCIETLLGFNRLMAGTSLPTVPREELREIIERDIMQLLGIND